MEEEEMNGTGIGSLSRKKKGAAPLAKKKKVGKTSNVIDKGVLSKGLKTEIASVISKPSAAELAARKVKKARAMANIAPGANVSIKVDNAYMKGKIVKKYSGKDGKDSVLVRNKKAEYFGAPAVALGRSMADKTIVAKGKKLAKNKGFYDLLGN